ncbi:metalloreductase STEAP3-like [Branchiostoma lanceolatum]|uniref:metalloreductase STEAP3-like n=1 Tax=Branchiostoma lanceolatum TaxID=7740 RepID=UPI0034539228
MTANYSTFSNGAQMSAVSVEEGRARNDREPGRQTVAILGSGDYSRSLAGRLVQAGFPVLVGSRDPDRNARFFTQGADVTTRRAALSGAGLVFVAIHRENYPDLQADRDALAGKILIDVSNNTKDDKTLGVTDIPVLFYRSKIHEGESNAEYLASLFPDSTVVKGFNVVSAWSLSSGLFGGSKEVLISSDDANARKTVMQLAQDLGFVPVDYGSLRAAREIEAIPLRLLPSWHLALKMFLGVFVIFFLYCLYRIVIFRAITGTNQASHIPVSVMNMTFAGTAITLLCLVYIPGIFAAFAQLYNGTKYKRFPNWLDKWMLARKQLGLLSLLASIVHAFLSFMIWSPSYYARLFEQTVTPSGEVKYGKLRWSGETFLLFGALSLFLMAILGVSSIPSVTNAMNWREFNFVQSKLGWAVLIFAIVHNAVYGAEVFTLQRLFSPYTIAVFQLTLVLPAILVLMKVVTLLPCVGPRVDRIRRGWERNKPATHAITTEEPQEETSLMSA